MWPFEKQAELLRLLGHLASYNDKGIDYARHDPSQVEEERSIGLSRIKELVAEIGPDSLPQEFLQAVASGAVATDFTGKYIDILKPHVRNPGVP